MFPHGCRCAVVVRMDVEHRCVQAKGCCHVRFEVERRGGAIDLGSDGLGVDERRDMH